MQISPGSPIGISSVGSSSERIEISVAGSGSPIDPSLPFSTGLQVATGAVSLKP
jgi:hypothetical protein